MARTRYMQTSIRPVSVGGLLGVVDNIPWEVRLRGSVTPVTFYLTEGATSGFPGSVANLAVVGGNVEASSTPGSELWLDSGVKYDEYTTADGAAPSGENPLLKVGAGGSISPSIINDVELRAEKAKLPIALSDYGVEFGTGFTDAGNRADATALINQAAADAYAQGRKLVSGRGGWLKTTGTVLLDDIDVDLSDVTLRVNFAFPLGARTPAVKVFHAGLQYFNRVVHRHIKLPRVILGTAYTGADVTRSRWITGAGTTSTDNSDIGVQLVNCEGCMIWVPYAQHFSTGLEVMGSGAVTSGSAGIGAGSVYNTIIIGQLTHNRINHKVGRLDSLGWSNSNICIGGGYNHYPAEGSVRLPGCRHVVIELIDDLSYVANGNVWIGGSMEGDLSEYDIECEGQQNTWRDIRFEKASTDSRVWWRGSGTVAKAADNMVLDGMGLTQLEQVSDAGVSRNGVVGLRRHQLEALVPFERIGQTDFLGARRIGDAVDRFVIDVHGDHRWSDGTLAFDTSLRRWAPNALLLATDDAFFLGSANGTGGSFLGFMEQSAAPSSGGADTLRMYALDFSGKTMLYKRDSSRIELLPGSLYGSASWNPGSLIVGASEKVSVTVTGAELGDPARAGLTTLTGAGWEISATVIAANTVEVKITNNTGGVVDLANGTVRAVVTKFT